MDLDRVPLLQDGGLALEPLRVDHAAEMASVLDDARLHQFTGGAPATEAQLRERYRRQVKGWSADGSERWLNWVVRRREDRLTVGYVQATVRDSEDGPVADVAWVVGPVHQGKGYAKDAARLMLDWLRAQGVRVVTAHIHPEHAASQAVARSLGLAPTETVHDGEVRWIG